MKLRIARKIIRDFGQKVNKEGIYRKHHKLEVIRYSKEQERIAHKQIWKLIKRTPDEPDTPLAPLTPDETAFRHSLKKAMSGDNSVRTVVNLGNLKDHEFNIPF